MELYRTDRIDCYDVFVDNQLWKRRIGWSKVLEALRKAMLLQRTELFLSRVITKPSNHTYKTMRQHKSLKIFFLSLIPKQAR